MTIHRGLEGITVAQTRLSRVDGQRGELLIAGQHVADLPGFEEVVARLWAAADMAPLERARVPVVVPPLADGMAAVRAALAVAAPDSPSAILGTLAAAAGAWVRQQAGLPVIAPDPARGFAADLLHMTLGDIDRAAVRAEALDTYLATVSDHGLNASTFTARVVASTRSDDLSAVLAAIGALKGPLHGGAPGPVLDMLDEIETLERVAPWLQAELTAGRRIMGMGHRVYRVRDPRAEALEMALGRLVEAGLGGQRIALAQAVEEAATRLLTDLHPDRKIAANVEFATAILLEAIGVPRPAFPVVFACGRAAGWLAHIAEERRDGRIIRPRAQYVGPVPGDGDKII